MNKNKEIKVAFSNASYDETTTMWVLASPIIGYAVLYIAAYMGWGN